MFVMSMRSASSSMAHMLWLAAVALCAISDGKAQPAPRPGSPPTHISRAALPSNVREYVIALGDRLHNPGKERLTLTGTSTDGRYGTSPARMVWEAPGRLRFDRNAPGAPALIFDDVAGVANAGSLAESDRDVLESLQDDSVEAFLYGFSRGQAHRFLGGRFRTDDGKTPNYAGPWFDIYEVVASAQPVRVASPRQKFFFFDSLNKLHVRTAYIVMRGNVRVPISTEYARWAVQGGQATQGQIIRKENGAAVFTFDINAASVSPAAKDGLFPGH